MFTLLKFTNNLCLALCNATGAWLMYHPDTGFVAIQFQTANRIMANQKVDPKVYTVDNLPTAADNIKYGCTIHSISLPGAKRAA